MSYGKCERCGRKMAGSSSDGVDWYLTYCQKCNQIVGREKEHAEKEAKRKAEQAEIERERAYARNAKLAEKKELEKIKYQKEIQASGGRICVICGGRNDSSLNALIPSSMCMSCRSHARDLLRKFNR